jgi:transcriptional antiterminator NusG
MLSFSTEEAMLKQLPNEPSGDTESRQQAESEFDQAFVESEDELLNEDVGEPGESEESEEESGPQAEWFVVHCYSGMENKVKKNLEHRAESMGMTDKILQVIVPTETEIEIKDGVRREVERKVFPGYILIQMIKDVESWYVVRNTPGVTSFVGIGNEPTPLRPDEVEKILKRIETDQPRVKVSFEVGERVRILGGPFSEFTGVVDEIYPDKGKAKVMVSFFNRETPVEVDFLQLERE